MDIELLRRTIRGTVTVAGDAGYEGTCGGLLFNRRRPDRLPQIIVRAATVEDVQAVVRFAAGQGIRISPRGSGHNFSGIALQEGIVLDLGALDQIAVDVNARIAAVGPAARNGALAATLGEYGLAFPVGHCHTVSVSGYLLGGGIGWNSGAWGLACHNIVAAEVVLPNGELIRASADENPDVFWALRGGGPRFFGVVVRYWLRLHPLPKAITSSLWFYPIERVQEVQDWISAAVSNGPETLEFAVIMTSPPPFLPISGKVLVGSATVFADSEAEARATLTNVAALAPDGALASEQNLPMDFAALYEATAVSFYAGERYAVDSSWSMDARRLFEDLAEAVKLAPSEKSYALGVVLPPSAGKAGLPDAAFSMAGPAFGAAYAIWDNPADDKANVDWLHETEDRLASISHGHYVGEADLERPGHLEACWSPEAWQRLEQLRAKYDPTDLFGRVLPQAALTRLAG